MNSTITTFASFILTLGILVFVHEMGHYIAARLLKVGVKRFSIGFGPKLFSFNDKYGTSWQVAAIPLGGFVEMEGEFGKLTHPDSKAKKSAAERLSLGGRSIIAVAGPLANILFAIVSIWVLFVSLGTPVEGNLAEQGFGGIVQNSPADKAGLIAGDIPTSINGNSVFSFTEFATAIQQSQFNSGSPQEIEITVSRQGEKKTFLITPEANAEGNLIVGVFAPAASYQPIGAFDAIGKSFYYVADICLRIFEALKNIIVDHDTSQLAGPVKIAQASANAASSGVFTFLNFLALFSINLAIFNLLPIPALDGGYIVLFALAKVFGRNFAEKVAKISIPIGVVFLILLMVFIIFKDIWRA